MLAIHSVDLILKISALFWDIYVVSGKKLEDEESESVRILLTLFTGFDARGTIWL